MKTLRICAILCCSLIFISWADSWDGLKEGTKNFQSIQSPFIQKKYMKILDKPIVSEGKLFFQVPKSLRWEYNRPIKSVLLMHGRTVKRYIQRGKTMVEDKGLNMQAMQIVAQEITHWLNGEFDKNKDFSATLQKGNPRKIVLTPKEEALAKIISRISMDLSDTPGIIKKVTIYEGGDNRIEMEFIGPQLNKKIDPSVFKVL